MLTDIVRVAIKRSNVSMDQIAFKLGRETSTLYAQLDSQQSAKLPADDVLVIMKMTGSASPLRWLLLEWSKWLGGLGE